VESEVQPTSANEQAAEISRKDICLIAIGSTLPKNFPKFASVTKSNLFSQLGIAAN